MSARLIALGLVAGLAAGCAAGPRPRGIAPEGAAEPGLPWEVPAAAYGTQRLYRAAYAGPEGEGALRATLRLLAPDRFELVLADRLGRSLYTLRVEGDAGWWLDHRQEAYCDDLGALDLPGLGDAPVEARALAALLLGVIPAAGARQEAAGGGGEGIALRDAAGRRWTAVVADGRAVRWTLWDDDGPAWWWQRDDGGGTLSGREGRQLRWQEVVVERLAGLPSPPSRSGMREDCEPGPAGRPAP